VAESTRAAAQDDQIGSKLEAEELLGSQVPPAIVAVTRLITPVRRERNARLKRLLSVEIDVTCEVKHVEIVPFNLQFLLYKGLGRRIPHMCNGAEHLGNEACFLASVP